MATYIKYVENTNNLKNNQYVMYTSDFDFSSDLKSGLKLNSKGLYKRKGEISYYLNDVEAKLAIKLGAEFADIKTELALKEEDSITKCIEDINKIKEVFENFQVQKTENERVIAELRAELNRMKSTKNSTEN